MTEICDMMVGARGIILQYSKDSELTWTRIFCELIDNSLDAKAGRIRIVRRGEVMTVSDDGIGCAEPDNLVNLGCSYKHGGDRSGFFGLGGTISGIRASRGSQVKYTTTWDGVTHIRVANWARMVEENHLFYEKLSREAAPEERGTKIEIRNCMRFKDLDKVVRDLGFLYADALKGGLTVSLLIDGKPRMVAPYEPPSFVEEVEFAFDCEGFPVRGSCGLVASGEPNLYEGWVIHWGPHRVLARVPDPADGRSVRRLHGHVYLPSGWENINATKDDFAHPPETLFDLIASHCARIIEAADEASTDYELDCFTERVEVALNASLPPRVKGRRPGSAGKDGTVEPAGTDLEHREFGPHQPGDRGRPRDPRGDDERLVGYPFKLEWRDDLEAPWKIEFSRSRRSPSRIYLDRSNPGFFGFLERDEPFGLMTVIHLLVSHRLGRGEGQQGRFGCFEQWVAEEWFAQFTTTRVAAALPAGL